MMVGGLPKNPEPRNPFKYNVTWSVDGLINEYKDSCNILRDGQVESVDGMEGLEDIDTEIGPLECFYTSGGASHSIDSMIARGVRNCSYKTLRYRGHCRLVKFLIRDCYLPDSCLKQLFQVGCSGSEKDLVIIKVLITTGGEEETPLNKEIVVDSDDNLSAMQKATAFPISAVASIMAEGKLDGLSSVSYGDIPQKEFNQKLSDLGITFSL
jgi:saccharopine dehydrogenase-like NADP-dependent oxidoreductase